MMWAQETLEAAISRRRRTVTTEQLHRQHVLASAIGCTVPATRKPRQRAATKTRPSRKDAARTRAEILIDEVQWLVGTDSTDAIARRLGYSDAATLKAKLRRIAARHPDLAARCRLSRL